LPGNPKKKTCFRNLMRPPKSPPRLKANRGGFPKTSFFLDGTVFKPTSPKKKKRKKKTTAAVSGPPTGPAHQHPRPGHPKAPSIRGHGIAKKKKEKDRSSASSKTPESCSGPIGIRSTEAGTVPNCCFNEKPKQTPNRLGWVLAEKIKRCPTLRIGAPNSKFNDKTHQAQKPRGTAEGKTNPGGGVPAF